MAQSAFSLRKIYVLTLYCEEKEFKLSLAWDWNKSQVLRKVNWAIWLWSPLKLYMYNTSIKSCQILWCWRFFSFPTVKHKNKFTGFILTFHFILWSDIRWWTLYIREFKFLIEIISKAEFPCMSISFTLGIHWGRSASFPFYYYRWRSFLTLACKWAIWILFLQCCCCLFSYH